MAFTRELSPLPFDLTIMNTDQGVMWEQQWHASTGVAKVDFTMDVRNVVLGESAAVSLKPAIQFAEVRTDRPDGGGLIAAGSAATTSGLTHYQETLSGSTKFFFRRGVGFKLTAGSFARAQGLLYTAFNTFGTVFPVQEVAFQPTNDTDAVSYFPILGPRPVPTAGVDVAKAVVFGLDNLNSGLEWRLEGRVFDDPLARGAWTNLENWRSTSAGDFAVNTGEVSLSGLSPSTKMWLDLALAVRKATTQTANSRCLFRIIPALRYT